MAWTNPITWVAGTLSSTTLNAQVRDNFKAIGDPWTSWSTTWTASTTNPTLGNGTIVGGYMQAGKLIHFWFVITFGSTTTAGSGNYIFSLPVAALVTTAHASPGPADWVDTSAGTVNHGFLSRINGTTVRIHSGAGAAVSATTYTWATGDTISGSGTYEAA